MPICMSSSSSEAATSYIFDVFLSFRGDTRKLFTSHLYNRLISNSFRVYLDEKEMNKGEEITEDLERAIFKSRICIPIFSKNYASSKACLRELSHMVQCGRKIIPIFYDVTPNDVKLKTPLYKEQLKDHHASSKVKLDEVVKWEKALEAVAEKAGYNLLDKNEAEEITTITQELIISLMPKQQAMTKKFVEMEDELKYVETLLDLRSNDFRIIGIFGTGGIGKTTLAKVVFNQLQASFPGCCSFLEDVRENLQAGNLIDLQRQLYKDVIDAFSGASIYNRNMGIEMIRKGLENKKVLLVFDDMNDKKQLTDLLGDHVHFISGSRLIITTRNREVLDALNREHKNVKAYELNELDDHRALKLFSKCAFMQNSPPEEFESLSEEVVSYTGGLPLALEVFGSKFSCSSKDTWRGILKSLKEVPDKSIESRLMISYHGLKSNEQKVFLDIAFYFGNLGKEYACYMWEDYGWYPEFALKTLKDHSLIKIVDNNGECFWMHDVLKDLGRALIQDEGAKSGKLPNRLLITDSLDKLHETEEKAHLEMLFIRAPAITSEDMVGLQNLRFLNLIVEKMEGDFSGLFPNLRWFSCSGVLDFELVNFNPKKLLILDLSGSNYTENFYNIWKAIKGATNKLKVLDLAKPGITRQYLRDFACLQQRLAPYNSDVGGWPITFQVGKLACDMFLSLISQLFSVLGWGQYMNLKQILNARNLEKLCLNTCFPITGLDELDKLLQLRHLDLRMVKFQYLQHLPSSLLFLELRDCEFVSGILDVSNLKSLEYLSIGKPNKLNEIKGLGELHSLEVLILNGIWELDEGCSYIEGFPLTVRNRGWPNFNILDDLGRYSCPTRLNIKNILTQAYLKNLKKLEFSMCFPLRELPLSDGVSLKRLSSLKLWLCANLERIVSFDGFESLTSLSLCYCLSLEILPDLSTLRKLRYLKLQGCYTLRRIRGGIPELDSLETVSITDCVSLELSPFDIAKLENVQSVYITGCQKLPEIRQGTRDPAGDGFLY